VGIHTGARDLGLPKEGCCGRRGDSVEERKEANAKRLVMVTWGQACWVRLSRSGLADTQ